MTTENLAIEITTDLSLNYKTFGLEKGGAPTVLIIHALTGNSNVAGENGWWKEIVGQEKLIDLSKYHVVAIDIPGNGSNNQCIDEIEEYDGYLIAGIIADQLKKAGYQSIDVALGGSLGGGLLWEILVDHPNWITQAFIIAAHYESTSWLKGITHVQQLLLNNSSFPIEDARKMAMLFYRSPEGINEKFNPSKTIQSWLDYHGTALKNRFSLKAYRFMNHLLGSIHATEGYKNISSALEKSKTEIIHIGVNSDLLFPAEEIRKTHEELSENGFNSHYHEIDSIHGHDAFLIEFEQLETIIKQYIITK